MPSVRSKAKPDPNKVYVAWQSHALGNTVVEKGSRRTGSDWAVQQAFAYWVEDGTADDAMPDVFGKPDPAEDNPEQVEALLMSDPASYQEPSLATLTRDVRVGVGLDHRGRPASVRTLRKGTVFPSNSELVVLKPNLFTNGKRS